MIASLPHLYFHVSAKLLYTPRRAMQAHLQANWMLNWMSTAPYHHCVPRQRQRRLIVSPAPTYLQRRPRPNYVVALSSESASTLCRRGEKAFCSLLAALRQDCKTGRVCIGGAPSPSQVDSARDRMPTRRVTQGLRESTGAARSRSRESDWPCAAHSS
eukprot:3682055-Pleurochrysis_carterae.AAC.1